MARNVFPLSWILATLSSITFRNWRFIVADQFSTLHCGFLGHIHIFHLSFLYSSLFASFQVAFPTASLQIFQIPTKVHLYSSEFPFILKKVRTFVLNPSITLPLKKFSAFFSMFTLSEKVLHSLPGL